MIIVLVTVFFHFFNQHKIVLATKDYAKLEKQLNAERTINTELSIENDQLSSRDRIYQIATQDMGMICPRTDGQSVIYIKESESEDKVSFSLIDFISPEAQALTHP